MDQTDFSQKSLDIESEYQKLENGQHPTCEDNGSSYSADHGSQLKTVLKKVHQSVVARAKATHDDDLEYQKYEELRFGSI